MVPNPWHVIGRTMNQIEARGQKLLIEQWNAMKAKLDQLGRPVVRPDDGYRIFSLIEDDPRTPAGQIAYCVDPVVFQVPERASDHASNMFIVVKGRIYLDNNALKNDKVLKTMNFGTEVGYFRFKDNKLNHVYGAHYDFSLNEVGHPVFHGQMRSFNDRCAVVSENYEGIGAESLDYMEKVLRNVRLPTAQMDFFGVVLQIAADHLMNKDSSEEQKGIFEELCELSKEIQGAAHRWLELKEAGSCMRARHWYPDKRRLEAKA
jgi:hypothetical protein